MAANSKKKVVYPLQCPKIIKNKILLLRAADLRIENVFSEFENNKIV
jgi:hypothetical protein